MEILLGLICTCQVKIIINICTMLIALFGSIFWWKWWDNMAIIYFHFSINPWKNLVSFYPYLKRINDMQHCFWKIHLTNYQFFNLQFAYFNFKWESCTGCMPLAPNSQCQGHGDFINVSIFSFPFNCFLTYDILEQGEVGVYCRHLM